MFLSEEEKNKIKEEEKLGAGIRKEEERKEQSKKSTGCLLLLIFIFILIILINIGGEKKSSPSNSSNSTETHSNAFMLASLEVGNTSPSASSVDAFNVLLKDLTRKCPKETESQISDYIVTAEEIIEKKGKKITLFEMGNSINKSIPEEAIGIATCKETTAALTILLTAN